MQEGLDVPAFLERGAGDATEAADPGEPDAPAATELAPRGELWIPGDNGVAGPGGRRTLLWFALATGAFGLVLAYYSAPAPGRADRGFLGPTGAFGLAFGVVGLAMTLIGVVTYAVQKHTLSRAALLRPRFTLHAVLCTLGAFFIVLHTGFALTGGLGVITWAALLVVLSIGLGRHLWTWIPLSADGRLIESAQLAHARERWLGRLWAMTDVPPDRLDQLLSSELPAGELGPLRALELSFLDRLRRRRRMRRHRAAVDILQVPSATVPQAMQALAGHWRVLTLIRLTAPLQSLLKTWRAVHLPLGFAACAVLAVRLAVLVVAEPTWIS